MARGMRGSCEQLLGNWLVVLWQLTNVSYATPTQMMKGVIDTSVDVFHISGCISLRVIKHTKPMNKILKRKIIAGLYHKRRPYTIVFHGDFYNADILTLVGTCHLSSYSGGIHCQVDELQHDPPTPASPNTPTVGVCR